MQNWSSIFQSFSFQSSNFQFCHFSPLTFNCYQFSILLNSSYVLPLIEPKRCRFDFFFNKFQNLKKIKKKKLILKKKKKRRRKRKHYLKSKPTQRTTTRTRTQLPLIKSINEGGGQRGLSKEEECAKSWDGEEDSEDVGPSFFAYASRRVWSLPFLLHCHGVLLRQRLAFFAPQTTPQTLLPRCVGFDFWYKCFLFLF